MNYYQYNISCILTSIIFFLLVLLKWNEMNFCYILILAGLFSVLWRSTKILIGPEKIIHDEDGKVNENKQLKHPLFILDITFAILAFTCVFINNHVNKKLFFVVMLAFLIAWILHFIGAEIKKENNYYINTSNDMHLLGHCYVIILILITYYLEIR